VSLLALEEMEVPAEEPQVGSPTTDARSDDSQQQRDKNNRDIEDNEGPSESTGESPQTALAVEQSGGGGECAAREDHDAGDQGKHVRALTEEEIAAALERSNQLMLDGVTLSMQAELEGEGLEEGGWEARLQDEGMEGDGAEDREYDSEGGQDSALQWDA
jgi:hypothetical protein